MYFKPQTSRIILFCALFFATFTTFSQTPILSENFNSQPGIWNSGGLGYVSNGNTIEGSHSLRIINGETATSPVFNTNLYSSLTLSFSFRPQQMEDGDEIMVEFYDGTTWIVLASYIIDGATYSNGNNYLLNTTTINNPPTSFPVNAQLRFTTVSHSGNSSDRFFIDSILVEGFVTGPEINIQGGSPLIDILDGNTAISTTDDTDFGSIDVASGNNANVFTIENNGTSDLTITSVTGGTADFVITGTTSGTITAGNSITFTVTFDPTTVGTKTTTISIANNDTTGGENPYTFNVEGVGTTTTNSEVIVSVNWPNWSSENTVEIYSPSGSLISTIIDTSGSGDSSYSTTVNLGCLEDLNNYYFIMYDTYGDGWNGADNITISSSGVNVINNDDAFYGGATISGRTVSFNVSGGICGAEINVLGNGTSITDGETLTSSGDYTNFGDIDTGTSFTRTFTIENTGASDLTIGGTVTLTTNTLFKVTTQPSATVLTTGTSTTFVITFSPVALGTFTDVVTITNDDSNEDPYTFTISGNGAVPLTEGPGGVTSKLALWLKSTDGLGNSDGTGVSLWQTQARGSNATVNSAGQEPTFYDNTTNNVNFNPVISFNNDRTNAPEEYNYAYTPQEYLEGTSGFYSQEIFIVAIPDDVINNTYASMDLFCGDSPLVVSSEDDGTGIGYGSYTQRFDTESITYAIGTTSNTSNPANDRGYGIADTNASSSYSGIAILNVRDNTSAPIDGSELYYNGKNIESEEVGVPQFINIEDTRFWIGRSQGYRASFEGRVAEVITYSTRKNDTSERNKIESYLAIKYGITLADAGVGTTKNYVNSDGTVIWNYTANAGFNYDIAGIGRDDASELNQKQSKSINSTSVVTIGHGDIATTNSANSNNFSTNKDYLVWGHNNAALSGSDVLSVNLGASTTSVTTLFDRRWKIVESRPTASNDILDVKVSIPNTFLPAISSTEEYALVVSSTPVFGSNDIVDIIPLKANGSNYETWYDFDNTRFFTFGVASKITGKFNVEFTTGDFLVGENAVHLNSNFTVSAWVRNLGAGGTYVSKGLAYDFKLKGSGNVEVYTNNTLRATSVEIIKDAKWHHVAVTNNGSNLLIYIDGVLDTTASSVAPANTTDRFAIGVVYIDKNNITTPFNGDIDEIRIWDSALAQNQIQYIMNQEIVDVSTNVNGEILPQTTTLNTVSSIPWNNVQTYHNINSFYGTTVEDGSNNNNWVRIKYLTIGKDIIDNQSAPLPYVSTASSNWDLTSTWANSSEIVIPNSLGIDGITSIDWNIVETNNNVNTTRGVKVLGLKVNSNEFSINSDNSLEISHYLRLDGVLDLDGESQLIQTIDSDFDAASTGYLERDQQGEFNRYRYNYWSSPVLRQGAGNASSTVDGNPIAGTSFSIADVLRDGTIPNSPAALNYTGGYDGSISPLTLSTYWMYKYANHPEGTYSAWEHIGNTGALYAGEGFIMKGAGDPDIPETAQQNYVFEGKPNNGTITLTVAPTYSYLVGNPYPSALDANQFLIDNSPLPGGRNSIRGEIYFWEHYGGDSHNLRDYQGGYATYNFSGAVQGASPQSDVNQTAPVSPKIPGQYIAVGQSFYVVGEPGGIIEFNNGQRTFEKEATGVSVFMKSSSAKSKIVTANKTDLRSKFRIGFEAPKINHRQLLLTIDEKASDNVDWGYDSEIYNIVNDDMYWILDAKKYVIQATNAISLDKEIPLGIETKEGGTIRIMIDALENIDENTKIYIKDKLTGETYDITNQVFEINLEAGEYQERFVLAFQPRIKTFEEVTLIEGVHVFMNNTISELQLNRIVDTEIQGVTLFNYLGQQVKTWSINTDERFISLPLQIATGVYIVRVNTTAGVITKKMIIE
ncbi:choice-of-anchor D domain-containing protein [uncultured Lutibacter sp.]|uniref:choice-of-anchor D domain-containing protein n=1 Tax=uncultured Lutibacter sp. TaxID=437739 RepID=UPI00261D8D1F|nr:choice-of-anchor D domain-containing protein [uncultured Lutibacter sp.]